MKLNVDNQNTKCKTTLSICTNEFDFDLNYKNNKVNYHSDE